MVRTLLILWLVPVFLLGSWYGLSYYDINFGTMALSRELHDLVFRIYGNMLGIAPEAIPLLVLKAIAFDSLLVLAIIAYRLRKSWWPGFKAFFYRASPQALSVADLDSPAK